MAESIIIPLNDTVANMVGKAKSAIEGAGGNFNGDLHEGTFNVPVMIGKIAGKYTVREKEFVVDITDKPMMIPTSLIEEQLRKYMGA